MTDKTKHYPDVASNANFPQIENEILEFWKRENIFQKSIDSRKSGNDSHEFVFYDGPPFANGLPHHGHLLTGFVKDIFARYQTMLGKKVERRFGWDCHGLPAEMGAEKELGISGRMQIMEYGVNKFNDHCRQSVLKYRGYWEEYVTKQARWVDFENDYRTMDIKYMESVMWAFKQLYDKGLVYESMRVMPYSWACETPLSNFETRLDNSYRERADKAVTVAFTLRSAPPSAPKEYKSYKILAWTTTPWTLPSNLALAVGADIDYTYIIKDEECYIIAASSAAKYAKEFNLEKDYKPSILFKGSELEGLEYQPLLPYFANHPNSFKVLIGSFVMEGDGTGVVHMAPGFGEDDFNLCNEHNIGLVCPVDNSGKFTDEVSDFKGMQVFDANDEIIKMLKNHGSWIKTEQYLHNYPHCWRTDTPLIYKAVPSWYVEVTKFKDRMVELNKQINWIPSGVKDGIFGKWLENARDWSISRNRFWGAPIPIWRSDDPKYPRIDVYGSIEEIEKDFGVKVLDLHKPFIDELVRPNPNDPTGKSMMRRVPDVFDCWFESGSMPYAQAHYPFENKEWFENHFPADFIVEYVAQTRGWFYTLMVLSTALFDRPPFLNCICHGVILDENGQKLSKRLQNYVNPLDVFKLYGADALRFLMVSSPVMRGQELLIDKDGNMVKDVLRLAIKPIWNAYNFFCLYANSDGIEAKLSYDSSNVLDKYILSKLKDFTEKVKASFDAYDTPSITDEVIDFFEILNNWYIRRSRSRFWKSEKDQDKQDAYNSLYTVLHVVCRAIAPILPLTLEEIYLGLVAKGEKISEKSVHLAYFPDVTNIKYDADLVDKMDKVRDICSASLSIRNDKNIGVRQPLSTLTVAGRGLEIVEEFADIIKDELNVKNINLTNDIDKFASFKLQLNFKEIGKRIPAKVKDLIAASKAGKWEKQSNDLLVDGEKLLINEYDLKLEAIDKDSSANLSSGDGVVILDLNITEELKEEGIARNLVRIIQTARKDQNFDVSDHIKLQLQLPGLIKQVTEKFEEYISTQTLCDEIIYKEDISSNALELSLDEEKIYMLIEKI